MPTEPEHLDCVGERRHTPVVIHCAMQDHIDSLIKGVNAINEKWDDWMKKMYIGNGTPSFNARVTHTEEELRKLCNDIDDMKGAITKGISLLLIGIGSFILLHVFKVIP